MQRANLYLSNLVLREWRRNTSAIGDVIEAVPSIRSGTREME
ncbi:DinB family protein [Alicyclobacillus hesperidum URH17-3-68]|nr:DinB family protein [Alicyclobacillus hesperidum URH17-3-68]